MDWPTQNLLSSHWFTFNKLVKSTVLGQKSQQKYPDNLVRSSVSCLGQSCKVKVLFIGQTRWVKYLKTFNPAEMPTPNCFPKLLFMAIGFCSVRNSLLVMIKIMTSKKFFHKEIYVFFFILPCDHCLKL